MRIQVPKVPLIIFFLAGFFCFPLQGQGMHYSRSTASYETLNLNNFKEGFKLLYKSDGSFEKASRLSRLYAERSLRVCAEEAIKDLSKAEVQAAYVFSLYFGSKCLGRLAVTSQTEDVHKQWLEYVIDYETSVNRDLFLETEKNLISEAVLNARESLFRKSDELGLDDIKTEALARRIWGTQSKSILTKLFEFYMNKNDQDSAKQVLKDFSPDLSDVNIVKKINQHFPNEIYALKIKNIEEASSNYRQLRSFYRTKKYSSVLPLYKKSFFKDTKQYTAASRVIAWTYAYAKEDLQKQIIADFGKLEVDFTTFAWILANRGLHEDVFKAFEQVEVKTADHYAMALRALLYAGDYKKSAKTIEQMEVVAKAKTWNAKKTKAAQKEEVLQPEVVYWATMNLIRNKDYKKVLNLLDLLIKDDSDFRLQGMYYKHRILKHELKNKSYKKVAEEIIKNYPLTFYGVLVAHEEGLTNMLPFLKPEATLNLQMSLENQSDVRRLKQILFILEEKKSASFRPFVEKSLTDLSLSAQVLMAKHYQDLGEPLQAIKIMNNVWTIDHSLIQPEIISIAYPTDLLPKVKDNVAEGMDPKMILAVIRQESAFQERAVSSARARGLMQLLLPTAREMARSLRLRRIGPASLFNPDLNIRLGSYYLKRLSRSYDEHMPLAFAAYNAGPGRMRKWSASRDIITHAQESKYSDDWKDQDLWVEEMPWSETRFYVKALLRNYALYALFEDYKPLQKCFRLWNCQSSEKQEESPE